jgi:uncharacterized membrane protein YhiD involved in acid resistance
MKDILNISTSAPLSITNLLVNLGIGVVLSILLRYHFKKFGSTLSNRDEFSHVCPFILLTTVLIITVVKSSLALSLGLVGALSIVRFRTPIKEPEELAYLFISIAMGLGLGADQAVPTLVAGPAILLVMAMFKWTRRESNNKNLYLSLVLIDCDDMGGNLLNNLNKIIKKHSTLSDLRRMDTRENNLEATYFIDIETSDNLSDLSDEMKKLFPKIGITFIDQNQMPSV